MSWLRIRVTTTGATGATVGGAFEQAGALAVSTAPLDRDAFDGATSLDVPQTDVWDRVCVEGLFDPVFWFSTYGTFRQSRLSC